HAPSMTGAAPPVPSTRRRHHPLTLRRRVRRLPGVAGADILLTIPGTADLQWPHESWIITSILGARTAVGTPCPPPFPRSAGRARGRKPAHPVKAHATARPDIKAALTSRSR